MMRWTVIVLASLSWMFAFHHFASPALSNGWLAPLATFCVTPFVDGKTAANEATYAQMSKQERTAAVAVEAAAIGADVAERIQARVGARFTQWLFIAFALIAAVIGLGLSERDERLGMAWGVLALPLIAALLIALPPYRPALAVLALGFIAVAFGMGQVTRVARGTLIVGGVLVLQCASFWMATTWMAKNPQVPGVGQVLYTLLHWVGADVSTSGGVLFVRMMRTVHVFPLLWEHVGLFVLMQLWIGGLVLIWLTRGAVQAPARVLRLTLVLAGYALLRLFVLIPIFVTAMLFVNHDADTVHVEVFWLPWIQAASWLPLVLLLPRFVPVRGSGASEGAFVMANEPLRMPLYAAGVGALALIATTAGVVGKYYWDPGVLNQGRILLDEAHSEWERTDKAYDTNWYGHESGYNYYCMAQYLRNYYTLDFNMDGKLTPELLENYDVLILKTPTKRFDEDERKAIIKFVRDGGGVFAFGEHTNVFGTSACLNEIMQEFGLAFRYDSVFDLTRKWEQVYTPQGRTQQLLRSDTPLGVHPAMQDVPFFRFAVSCSVASSGPKGWKVRPIVRSTGLWALPIEYAASNFYPHVDDSTYAAFGAFDQIACTTYGKGRVIAFGDSTVYSNFLAFYPGKPEFLLGGVDWLNRQNDRDWVNGAAYAVAGGLVLVSLLIASRTRPHVGLLGMTAALVGSAGWLGIYGMSELTRASYPRPAPHTPTNTLVFDASHGSGGLPLFAFTKDYPNSYEIFYQWMLRAGYYTDVSFDLDQAFEGDRPIVIVMPNAKQDRPEVTSELVAKLRAFLERGGSVLILDHPDNEGSTANDFLQPFEMQLSPLVSNGGGSPGGALSIGVAQSPSGVRVCDLQQVLRVDGGESLLVDLQDNPILAVKRVGNGQLIVGGIANRFSDVRMGASSRSIPDRRMRIVYELEFALLRGMVNGDVADEMTTLFAALQPVEGPRQARAD